MDLKTEALALHKEHKGKLEDLIGGTIIYSDAKKGLYIKAKEDIVIAQEVQAENAKRMSIQDFLRGNPISMGEIFS